jgi:hypothetical protein
MSRIAWALGYILYGAALFWIPDFLIHRAAGMHFSGSHVISLLALLPLLSFSGAAAVYFVPTLQHRRCAPLFMLLGIYLCGGLAITANATFSGGGFATPEGRIFVLLGAIPPFTLMASAYDGTFLPLLLVSAGLPGIYAYAKRTKVA